MRSEIYFLLLQKIYLRQWRGQNQKIRGGKYKKKVK